LLLEWAFSLDLTNEAMPQLRTTLARLHEQAFGDWWLLLGISLTGLWGIHRGLVQRRTTETLAGLAATVALMVGGLLIISRPDDTVGWAARATNDAGMAVLAAGTGSRADDPRDALANSLRQVFDTTVREPWCALEFGSVDFCDVRTGDPSRATNAELWLAYPAQGWQRGRLHKLMKGDDGGGGLPDPLTAAKDVLGIGGDRKLPDDVESLVHKDSDRASIQEAGGTFPRLALLAIILVGLTGAIALYAYLGVRLVLAAGLGLVLLLVAPAMLIAPALGDGGRATFIAWLKRLLGAEVAKFVFAIFLTVVLTASRVFGGLELGWFGTWLLEAAFWWGIFIKRHEILDFVSGGLPQQHGDGIGHVLSHGYYAWMLGRGARQMASRATAPAGAGAEAVRTSRQEHQEARSAATRSLAGERLDERHRDEIVSGQDQARGVVAQREVLQRELRASDRRLAGHDEATAVANGPSPSHRRPTPSSASSSPTANTCEGCWPTPPRPRPSRPCATPTATARSPATRSRGPISTSIAHGAPRNCAAPTRTQPRRNKTCSSQPRHDRATAPQTSERDGGLTTTSSNSGAPRASRSCAPSAGNGAPGKDGVGDESRRCGGRRAPRDVRPLSRSPDRLDAHGLRSQRPERMPVDRPRRRRRTR
jgi:hypothetical protein